MKPDPHMKALIDVLVAVAVREIQQQARSGQKKARTDGNRKRANGQTDEDCTQT